MSIASRAAGPAVLIRPGGWANRIGIYGPILPRTRRQDRPTRLVAPPLTPHRAAVACRLAVPERRNRAMMTAGGRRARLYPVVRYFLIFLGVVTLALAVVLAWEQQWWAAIPDGAFGIGVAWVAWASLEEDRHERRAPKTEEEPVVVAQAQTAVPTAPRPEPVLPAQPASPPVHPLPRPKPKRGRSKHGRR